MIRKLLALSLSAAIFLTGCSSLSTTDVTPVTSAQVIKHVVVIFGENVSFDHYFATYPNATNPTGETAFTAVAGTPINQ